MQMKDVILEISQPYVTQIIQALVGLLAAVVLAGIMTLRKKVEAAIDSHTTAAQRETLHKIAAEAQAAAEAAWGSKEGQFKLQAAEGYVSKQLRELGINFSPTEIQAAIEKAVQDFNTAAKPAVPVVVKEAATDGEGV